MIDPDPISQLLDLVDARCQVTGGLRAGGDWAHRSTVRDAIKIDAVTEGRCWIVVDRRPPMQLAAGDAVILNGARTVVLCSDPARATAAIETRARRDGFFARIGDSPEVTVIGGHVALDPAGAQLFASALAPVLAARDRSHEATEIRSALAHIADEVATGRPGARFAADQHAQLLLLHVLRAGLGSEPVRHPGWLALMTDPDLRPAVALLHGDPGRAWGLVELAAAAGMSRSQFAHRFRRAAGQPPLTYLTHWRVQLARRALRGSATTIAALSQQLGYASESSFTHAFTRVTGVSPARYRRAHRPTTGERDEVPVLSAETASRARPR